MKACLAVFAVALAAILIGCGSESGTATSADAGSSERTATETTKAKQEPNYPLPKLPPKRDPLKKLYIKDLEIGKGPVARWGDTATVRYVGVFWKTGKVFSEHWGSAWTFKLDGEYFGPGWQKGIHGMKVGGRREFRTPGALINGLDAAYVVTLDEVKRDESG